MAKGGHFEFQYSNLSSKIVQTRKFAPAASLTFVRSPSFVLAWLHAFYFTSSLFPRALSFNPPWEEGGESLQSYQTKSASSSSSLLLTLPFSPLPLPHDKTYWVKPPPFPPLYSRTRIGKWLSVPANLLFIVTGNWVRGGGRSTPGRQPACASPTLTHEK